MLNRDECLDRAGAIFSEAYRVLFFAPLDEAARAAMRRGGPSFDELRVRITAHRAKYLGSTAQAHAA